MSINFRLLSETPYTQSVSSLLQMMNMAQQERMQAKQIASNEAQTMYTTEAQQQENAKDRSHQAGIQGARLAQNESQFKRTLDATKEQNAIENKRADKKADAYEDQVKLQAARLGFDMESANFDQQLQMADEARKQQSFDMSKLDTQQQQVLKQRLGEAYSKGGYNAAADMLGQMGAIGDAMEMRALGLQENKIKLDMQNAILQGKKTTEDLEDRNLQRKNTQFATALSSYMYDLAGTEDPQLKQSKLEHVADIIKQEKGIDYSHLLTTDKGRSVFLKAMVEMSNDWEQGLAHKAKDPNKSYRQALMLQDAYGDNPYFDQFAKGYAPTKKGIEINVPGYDKEGNVVFPNTKPTQNELQKDIMGMEDTKRLFDRIEQNMDTDLLTAQSKVQGKIAEATDLFGVSTKDQKSLIDKREQFLTPIKQGYQAYVLQQAATTFTDSLLEKLSEQYVNGDLSPRQFQTRFKELRKILDQNLEARKQTARQGGVNVSPANDAQQPSQQLSDSDKQQLIEVMKKRGLSWQ